MTWRCASFWPTKVPHPRAAVDRLAAAEDAMDGERGFEEVEAFIGSQVREFVGQWRPIEVRLDDGQPLTARGATAIRSTLLRVELEGHPITVTASGLVLTRLDLVRVVDPEPLITAMEQRWHGMVGIRSH
jgi:hypothetical protein